MKEAGPQRSGLSLATLKIGGVKDGTDYYVQKAGSPDVMMVKKFAVDRFFKKASDVSKTQAAAK